MAFSPGKNVGRVSIRVTPDTRRFRADLSKDLRQIERTMRMTVRVDQAKVDNAKVRESLRRQLAEFKDLDFAANVEVVVDKARIRRGKLRTSIQGQFDKMTDVTVWIAPKIHKRDEERFRLQVDRIIERASGESVDVGMTAHTAAASAQMRYVTRPRWVDVFVRINKRSLSTAVATLAALSGARLSWQWIDDLLQKVRNLDKTLPTLLAWTSGITALIAALAGGVGGLVGIGQGLFSITPALLVLPGLFLNALGSITALIVALRNSGTELAVLKDDMHAIGDVINDEFWGRARQPIIDLVQGLMPQLLNSFRNLSAGIGDFTAALAQAFGQELAGGRLESIFAGIAEGWRILGTGAAGFAGALVNLSEIAAKYTPRLASWFVRQANTFDNFLTSIATDGRLESWMEGAIDSMYDLWDATTGVAGVLENIWKAADQAGGQGLKGFADMMQEWKRVSGTARFQTGLSAVFRGSYVAVEAFSNAIGSLGDLIADMPLQFERFIGSAGGFIGRIFDESFKALNNGKVKVGLDGFSTGLNQAIDGIIPSLQPIADTFGNFLGLLGDLAANLLPTAAGVLAELMPTIDALIVPISNALPGLSGAVSSFVSDVAPSLTAFAEAVGPTLTDALTTLGSTLKDVGPSIAILAETAGPDLARALDNFVDAIKPMLALVEGLYNLVAMGMDFIKNPAALWDDNVMNEIGNRAIARGGWLADALTEARNFDRDFVTQMDQTGQKSADAMKNAIKNGLDGSAEAIASQWTLKLRQQFDISDSAGNAMWSSFAKSGLPPEVVAQVQANLEAMGVTVKDGMTKAGLDAALGMGAGITSGTPSLLNSASQIPAQIKNQFPPDLLAGVGRDLMSGLARGIDLSGGIVAAAAARQVGAAVTAAKRQAAINSPSRVMRDQVGKQMGAGLAWGLDLSRAGVAKSAAALVSTDMFPIGDGSGGPILGSRQITITQPLLPGETPAEQRDNLVRELSLIH